jgi:hypothetical protein
MQTRILAAVVAMATLPLANCTSREEPSTVLESRSSRRFKEDIAYASPSELEQLKEALVKVRLATFRYKQGDKARHLGFIIEDSPDIPASDVARSRVDLYAYTSMAVAALQVQARQIEQLEAEVDVLSNEVENLSARRQGQGLSAAPRPGIRNGATALCP